MQKTERRIKIKWNNSSWEMEHLQFNGLYFQQFEEFGSYLQKYSEKYKAS